MLGCRACGQLGLLTGSAQLLALAGEALAEVRNANSEPVSIPF